MGSTSSMRYEHITSAPVTSVLFYLYFKELDTVANEERMLIAGRIPSTVLIYMVKKTL